MDPWVLVTTRDLVRKLDDALDILTGEERLIITSIILKGVPIEELARKCMGKHSLSHSIKNPCPR